MTESLGQFLKERLKESDLEEGRREDELTILNKNLPLCYIWSLLLFLFIYTFMTSDIQDLYPSWLID